MSTAVEERDHWRSVIRAFDGYMRYHLSANHARRMAFLSLPKESKEMFNLIGYRDKLDAVDEGIRRNAEFIEELIAQPVFADMLEPDQSEPEHSHNSGNGNGNDSSKSPHSHTHSHSDSAHGQAHSHSHSRPQSPNNSNRNKRSQTQAESDLAQDKIRSTLRSFVRDWAVQGQREREACYDPCLEALERYFPSSATEGLSETQEGRRRVRDRREVRVLVPGCGLGRLAMEIAARGFASQGNEFSSYMLIASDWVLNRTSHRNSHSIYPYLHSFSNHLSTMHNLLLRVQIPDVCPSDVLGQGQGGDFSLVAGDFEEIYGPQSWDITPSSSNEDNDTGVEEGKVDQKGRYGAVVTCFFLDCARNVLNYLRIIHTILEEDGVWINIGPLLWHFENSPTTSPKGEGSIELSLDEVKELARRVGFVIHEEKMVKTTYTGIPDGMLKHEYNAAFWVATKRKPGDLHSHVDSGQTRPFSFNDTEMDLSAEMSPSLAM
ncbi:hypothetical protein CI109_105016 [Kwoniella shandongensis]|uniref:carnosine N-methyltransferase n=1 Tax=Kwoniella shandongensis TaxID=1734106 RepID=A0A5M6C152_9TREE|nr:uncharacterized protein CI109_004385 [Kwoniella shandongensis]KAA5527325.1 hypothetical protein CI109_004385 [Kwoniella shandongensis]